MQNSAIGWRKEKFSLKIGFDGRELTEAQEKYFKDSKKCEEKLAVLIAKVKREITTEKKRSSKAGCYK